MSSHDHVADAEKATEPSVQSGSEVTGPAPTSRDGEDVEKPAATKEDDAKFPSGLKLILIMISLYLAMFLVALVCLVLYLHISL